MELSIITINYNNKAGLKKTITSVMAQTWRDFEWIIIDGGSTDGSTEMITDLVKETKANISYWCSEKDNGVYNAMNKGIAHANGEYLNFMNSGDVFYAPNTLETVFHNSHTTDIIYGNWKRIWNDHEDIHSFPYPVELYSFYKENICHQAMFIKRDFHLKNLYDESYYALADYKNWTLSAIKGASFEYISLIVCIVTLDGISSTKKCSKEYDRLHKEFMPEAIWLSMKRIDELYCLNNEPYQKIVRELLLKNRVSCFITRYFLDIMKKLFI